MSFYIGDTALDITLETTEDEIRLHEWADVYPYLQLTDIP